MIRERKRNTYIIISLIGIMLLMAVGYAAFSTQLNVTGNSSITSKWDIKITKVQKTNTIGSAEEVGSPECDNLDSNNTCDSKIDNLTVNLEADL